MPKTYKIRRQDGRKVIMTYDEVLRLARAVTAAGLVQAGNLRQTVRREFGFG